ncbi:MAG: Gfo/Idh/MocA family oxidoreductase [Chloroflexi bacterium]|nr:Gfo/Idh/MocA family oxidoreductase [Chloroflexota bacterium]
MGDELRIGIIGFDTSHVPAFTKLLNDPRDPYYVPGAKVVCGYPSFSPDVESSYTRVEEFKQEMVNTWRVELVDSVEEVVARCDAVLLESVDGRRHLEEARPVIAARKPLYIDKPLAASYDEAAEIYRLAREVDCPVFSSSSLRFDANMVAIKNDPELGAVLGCDAFSPATLEPTNPGLFWYGVHGCEILYTFMGQGCQRVRCYSKAGADVVVGIWADGRLGTLRGTRRGAHEYGATVFGAGRVAQALRSRDVPLYAPLLREIMAFFRGGPPPVDPEETLEIMAFMQAALVSGQEWREVDLDEVR